jgi:hypothetical protein
MLTTTHWTTKTYLPLVVNVAAMIRSDAFLPLNSKQKSPPRLRKKGKTLEVRSKLSFKPPSPHGADMKETLRRKAEKKG